MQLVSRYHCCTGVEAKSNGRTVVANRHDNS